MAGPDYIVDIDGLKPREAEAPPVGRADGGGADASGGAGLGGRPWLAILWRCCSVYSRVYRNARGDAYEGRCPRCGKRVRARVGPGGSSSRFFEAG